MRGHKRFKDGAWRLTVYVRKDEATGKWEKAYRTVRAPNTKAGGAAADIELAKLVLEVEAGRAVAPTGITIEQLFARWVKHRRKAWEAKSPGQPEWTLNVVNRWVVPWIGDMPVAKLRPMDIDRMYGQWRDGGRPPARKGREPEAEREPLSEATVRRVHNILRACLQQAVRWDLRTDNPAERIEAPSPASPPRDAPPDDVLRALIDAAPIDYACYLRVAALTGARTGQLVALRWSDFDLDAGSVRFTRAHARVRGGFAVKETKAGVKNRLALDERTVALLRAHRARCVEKALAVGVALSPDAYVFAAANSPDSSVPWSPNAASKRWASFRGKVPGAEGVHAHDLRHWLATSLFEDGHDPVEVAGRGGWSSAAVPLRVYGHFRPAKDQQAAADLAERLDG